MLDLSTIFCTKGTTDISARPWSGVQVRNPDRGQLRSPAREVCPSLVVDFQEELHASPECPMIFPVRRGEGVVDAEGHRRAAGWASLSISEVFRPRWRRPGSCRSLRWFIRMVPGLERFECLALASSLETCVSTR